MAQKLEIFGNEATMNMENTLLTNILASPYFKELYALKTYHEVLDEIFNEVKNLEPWLDPNRKTPSTAFCLLYKLYTQRLTFKQMLGLIRGLGFLYLRYTAPPKQLWEWFMDYVDDKQQIALRGTKAPAVTIGKFVRDLLFELKYFETILPRIPVPVMRQIQQELKEWDIQNGNYAENNNNNNNNNNDDGTTKRKRSSSRDRDNRDRGRDRDREYRDRDRDYRDRDRDRLRDNRDRDYRRDDKYRSDGKYRSRSSSRDRDRDRDRDSHKRGRSRSREDRRDKYRRSSRSRSRDRKRSPTRSRSSSPRKSEQSDTTTTTTTATSRTSSLVSLEKLKAMYGATTHTSFNVDEINTPSSSKGNVISDTIVLGRKK